jgi:hypothetical protein
MMLTDGVLLMQDSESDKGILLINLSLQRLLCPISEDGSSKDQDLMIFEGKLIKINSIAPRTFQDLSEASLHIDRIP